MDINSAERNIKKLLTYVTNLADTKPKMYQKSRGRLKELADTCNEVVKVISRILQEEALKDDDAEFDSELDLQFTIESMQNQLDQIKSFAGMPVTPLSLISSNPTISASVPTESTTVSTNSKKKAIRLYHDAFQKISMIGFKYDCVDRCAKLLSDWMNIRFFQPILNSEFRYNMKKFPIWTRNIVVLFGKAIRQNDYISFDANFHRWLNSLASSGKTEKYAVPYDVYYFEKHMQPDDMSLESVILWDILWDSGLSALFSETNDELYLREDAVYKLCSELNPSILDSYMNYSEHPEIFTTLGWEVRANA